MELDAENRHRAGIWLHKMDARVRAIEFLEDEHEYWFTDSDGSRRRLHGITGVIGKKLGKSFPDTDIVKLATIYGSDVHKEVENYYNNGGELSSEGAKWVVEELSNFADGLIYDRAENIQCEVMVSDFEGTASKVDVVMHTVEGAYLFDIKTTSKFDREYCSLQLAVYKYLYEKCYDEKVLNTFVLATKSKNRFRTLDREESKIIQLLNMNKEE